MLLSTFAGQFHTESRIRFFHLGEDRHDVHPCASTKRHQEQLHGVGPGTMTATRFGRIQNDPVIGGTARYECESFSLTNFGVQHVVYGHGPLLVNKSAAMGRSCQCNPAGVRCKMSSSGSQKGLVASDDRPRIRYGYARANAYRALDVEMTPFDLHEIPGDGKTQAQTSAPPVARTVAPKETVEYVSQVLFGNPGPGIFDDDVDPMRSNNCAGESHGVSRRRGSDGVAQQIGHGPVQKLTIEMNPHVGLELV